jgi:hypothetical protein
MGGLRQKGHSSRNDFSLGNQNDQSGARVAAGAFGFLILNYAFL